MQGAGGAKPIFVDPSGRRSRRVQRVLWGLAVVLGCYVALVAVSLVGTPGLSRLSVPGMGSVLPGPRAPQLATRTGVRRPPARLLPPAVAPSPAPAPSKPAATSPLPALHSTPSPTRAASPVAAPTPTPTGPPRATPSTAASPTAVPSSSTRPTQRSSRAPTAHPTRKPR